MNGGFGGVLGGGWANRTPQNSPQLAQAQNWVQSNPTATAYAGPGSYAFGNKNYGMNHISAGDTGYGWSQFMNPFQSLGQAAPQVTFGNNLIQQNQQGNLTDQTSALHSLLSNPNLLQMLMQYIHGQGNATG